MSAQMPTQSEMFAMFQAVDQDRDGEIDDKELQAVLSNGTWLPFNEETIRLMINMFERSGRGKLRFEQFGALFKYVNDWRHCFSRFDADNSGTIDVNEFHMAVTTFGYRLSPAIISLLVAKYDRHKNGTLAFDDFIQCCIMLYTITGVFKDLDQDRDGWITINYEQFMHLVMSISGN